MTAQMKTVLTLACLLTALALLSAEVNAGEPAEKKSPTVSSAVRTDQKFGKWFALGSGCRARDDQPGDVRPAGFPLGTKEKSDHATFGLILPSFKLTPIESATRGFARECAIRVHLNSPGGYRLSRLRARLKMDVAKPHAGDLFLHQELKLGTDTLAIKQVRLTRQAMHDQNVAIELDSSENPETHLTKFDCGAKKIAGVDLTWIYKNRDSDGKPAGVNVQMGGDKSVVIEGEWTRCAASH
jgi:hypothetical protein